MNCNSRVADEAHHRFSRNPSLIAGQTVSAYFAMIAAWVGEKDLAVEQLSAVVQSRVTAPGCTHYGTLKTFPFWDPLRGDPRFEKIVQSLAPKQ